MAELERCIIIERVRAGMRRARLEGRQIGRSRLDVNRQQVIADRRSGLSLTQVAKKHKISRASVCRLVKEANGDQESVSVRALSLPVQPARRAFSMKQMPIEIVGKVFVVVRDGRRCVICDGVFTPTQAASHAIEQCYPQCVEHKQVAASCMLD